MQTALAFRLIDTGIPARPARARSTRRKRARRASQGWLKSLLLIVVVAAEWLLIAADVLSRIYLVC